MSPSLEMQLLSASPCSEAGVHCVYKRVLLRIGAPRTPQLHRENHPGKHPAAGKGGGAASSGHESLAEILFVAP